jgi:hypothetical protein
MIKLIAALAGERTSVGVVENPADLTHATCFTLPAGSDAWLLGDTHTRTVIVIATSGTHHQIADIAQARAHSAADVSGAYEGEIGRMKRMGRIGVLTHEGNLSQVILAEGRGVLEILETPRRRDAGEMKRLLACQLAGRRSSVVVAKGTFSG